MGRTNLYEKICWDLKEELDYKWDCLKEKTKEGNPQEIEQARLLYQTTFQTLTLAGFTWKRDKDGAHEVKTHS